jgi:hypothetical protein
MRAAFALLDFRVDPLAIALAVPGQRRADLIGADEIDSDCDTGGLRD